MIHSACIQSRFVLSVAIYRIHICLLCRVSRMFVLRNHIHTREDTVKLVGAASTSTTQPRCPNPKSTLNTWSLSLASLS